MRLFLASVLAVTLVLACSAASAQQGGDGAAAVVASQGGVSVTLADVDAFALTVPEDKRAQLFVSPERIKNIVNNLLAQKQLLKEARELKLQDDPETAARMEQAANAVLVKARVAALQHKFESEMPDLTALAHERYLANPAAYTVPAERDVKHILIGTKHRSDAEAKALAERLYKQLQADPSKFDEDMAKYSDDAGKDSNGGIITDATSTRYVRPFREAAGKLDDVGQLSPPVKSQFGYHIIKLVKYTPARARSFEEVRDAMVEKLQKNYVAKKVQHHLDVVRNRSIDVNAPVVRSLLTRYADAPAAADSAAKPASGSP
ncbi:MAG TPA: peptidylprolyl isomerase [Rhodanobacteraceae bacterium]|nr:peptidylprolyl isomerase [Rhodanobacteraceae bacterium]